MAEGTFERSARAAGLVLAIALVSLSVACRSAGVPEPAAVGEPVAPTVLGYSGLAQHGPASYLTVHDTKGHRDGPRLGLLEVTAEGGLRYTPLAVADWKHPDGRSSDLESACSLPRRPGEFLVAESGTWEGRYGRVFHLGLVGSEVEVVAVYELPRIVGSTEEQAGDNFEGMACVGLDDQRVRVILGERGGSSLYPKGLLRWGTLDLRAGSLAWHDAGRTFLEVVAPGAWPAAVSRRHVTALHAGADGILWAAAAADAGDVGPFRSVIYRVGRLTADAAAPVDLLRPPAVVWTLDGSKVEGLAAATGAVAGSVLGLGSEDEDLGGVWRALFPPVVESSEP